jgi:HSP20 family protein
MGTPAAVVRAELTSKETKIMNRIIRYTQPGVATASPLFSRSPSWIDLDGQAGRLLEAALADLPSVARAPRVPVDLYEDKDNHYVRAVLPGVSRDAVTVETADGVLTVTAARKNGDESVNLSRAIAIPESVQADKITAVYENGVLTVTLPKQEQAKPRKINIAVN